MGDVHKWIIPHTQMCVNTVVRAAALNFWVALILNTVASLWSGDGSCAWDEIYFALKSN